MTREGLADPSVPVELGERVRLIREDIRTKHPDQLQHELPGLVESVAETSRDTEDTEQFIIGVSFTENGTCFDYQLHRSVVRGETRDMETLKAPVEGESSYLMFSYPPDPNFGGGELRGALLSAVEGALDRLEAGDIENTGFADLISDLSGEGS